MSSSESDSEVEKARKARLAFALWEPPKPVEPSVQASKPVPTKPVVIGFQQPDFREVPKSLDTLVGGDVEPSKPDDVYDQSFVLTELAMTAKVTRNDFFRRFKDLSVVGLRMSAKERDEHVLAQQKGARMLDKALSEQIDFFDVPSGAVSRTMDVDDDNGGIQMFAGAKTRITKVQALEAPKIGLMSATSRPSGWDIKRSKRAASDSDSDSDSEDSRRRKVALAGVVVDFSTSKGFTGHTSAPPTSHGSMEVDPPVAESHSHSTKEKKEKKDKKDKKHKDKKHKDKKEKQHSNSKKRKREGSDGDNDASLG